jgi:hypothetical protein
MAAAFERIRADFVQYSPLITAALRSTGFRSAEADRAVTTLEPCSWEGRPIELLVGHVE